MKTVLLKRVACLFAAGYLYALAGCGIDEAASKDAQPFGSAIVRSSESMGGIPAMVGDLTPLALAAAAGAKSALTWLVSFAPNADARGGLSPGQVFAASKASGKEAHGLQHSCTLRPDATVACKGNNFFGQLGDNSTAEKLTLTTVSALTGVASLAAGDFHTCALKFDGSTWCWGYNGFGQLGDSTTIDKQAPTQVQGLGAATLLAIGSYHSCALKADGRAFCWGSNSAGQIGSGTQDDTLVPTDVVSLRGAVDLSAGEAHTCARRTNRKTRCLGDYRLEN